MFACVCVFVCVCFYGVCVCVFVWSVFVFYVCVHVSVLCVWMCVCMCGVCLCVYKCTQTPFMMFLLTVPLSLFSLSFLFLISSPLFSFSNILCRFFLLYFSLLPVVFQRSVCVCVYVCVCTCVCVYVCVYVCVCV